MGIPYKNDWQPPSSPDITSQYRAVTYATKPPNDAPPAENRLNDEDFGPVAYESSLGWIPQPE